jgi:predicted ribosomally synthesized peptide with nif11-like leader
LLNVIVRKEKSMPSDDITAFYEKVESDERLKTTLKRLTDESERAAAAEVVKIAESEGFNFTAEELSAFRAGRRETSRLFVQRVCVGSA